MQKSDVTAFNELEDLIKKKLAIGVDKVIGRCIVVNVLVAMST